MSSDPLSPYAEIDISTTDFGTLLSNLSVVEVAARMYRGKFRMPRIVIPTFLIDPKTGSGVIFESASNPNLRASIWFGTAQWVIDSGALGDAFGPSNTGRVTDFPFYFNGTNYDRQTYPTTIGNASAAGATSTQLLAAGGASKKYRIHGIAISAVATAAATDGVVSVNEVTSGTILLSMRVSATSAAVENLSMDFKGVPQPTANNAIQVTSIANTTTDATILATAAY